MVDAYLEHGEQRQAVGLLRVDVLHARNLTEAFQVARRDLRLRDRRQQRGGGKLRAAAGAEGSELEQKHLDVVVNVEVLTEGWDYPAISCLLLARPTESRSLLIQMVGRGLRQSAEKKDCLVIDFTDNTRRHKFGLGPGWTCWAARSGSSAEATLSEAWWS